MTKHPLHHLGGIIVSFSSPVMEHAADDGGGENNSTGGGGTSEADQAELLSSQLEASLLLLIQYDGLPLNLCDAVWNSTSALQVPCLVAYALKLQVLATLRIIDDVSPIVEVLDNPERRKE